MVQAADSIGDRVEAWDEPGADEVAPGVIRIPVSLEMDGLKAVNVYALLDGDRVTLIDPGMALEQSQKTLTSGLAEVGVALDDVTDVLVTHAHRDHYPMATILRRKFGSRIRMGVAEKPNMEAISVLGRRPIIPQVEILRKVGAGALATRIEGLVGSFDKGIWSLPDSWIDDRAQLDVGRSLRAIHTPGHTQGHLVFLDESATLLFAGDHVLPHITPSIGFEQIPTRSPLSNYLTSLHLLREMPDAVLLPGHGPVGASVHQRIDELLEHHTERLDGTLAGVEKGAGTAFEVARYLTWTGRGRRLEELDDFNTMLAVLETLWHLEVLAERGRLRRTEGTDGILYFQSGLDAMRTRATNWLEH